MAYAHISQINLPVVTRRMFQYFERTYAWSWFDILLLFLVACLAYTLWYFHSAPHLRAGLRKGIDLNDTLRKHEAELDTLDRAIAVDRSKCDKKFNSLRDEVAKREGDRKSQISSLELRRVEAEATVQRLENRLKVLESGSDHGRLHAQQREHTPISATKSAFGADPSLALPSDSTGSPHHNQETFIHLPGGRQTYTAGSIIRLEGLNRSTVRITLTANRTGSDGIIDELKSLIDHAEALDRELAISRQQYEFLQESANLERRLRNKEAQTMDDCQTRRRELEDERDAMYENLAALYDELEVARDENDKLRQAQQVQYHANSVGVQTDPDAQDARYRKLQEERNALHTKLFMNNVELESARSQIDILRNKQIRREAMIRTVEAKRPESAETRKKSKSVGVHTAAQPREARNWTQSRGTQTDEVKLQPAKRDVKSVGVQIAAAQPQEARNETQSRGVQTDEVQPQRKRREMKNSSSQTADPSAATVIHGKSAQSPEASTVDVGVQTVSPDLFRHPTTDAAVQTDNSRLKVAQPEDPCKEIKAEKDHLRRQLAAERIQHRMAQQQLAREQTDHDLTKQELAKEQTDHDEAEQKFEKEKADHEATRITLAATHKKYQEHKQVIKEMLREAFAKERNKAEAAKQHLSALRRNFRNVCQENAELKEQLKRSIVVPELSKTELPASSRSNQKDPVAHEKKVLDLSALLSSAQDEIYRLREENDAISTAKEYLEKNAEEALDDIVRLRKKNGDLELQNRQLQSSYDAQQKAFESQGRSFQNLSSMFTTATRESKDAQDEIKHLKDANTWISDDSKSAYKQIDQQKKEIELLKATMTKLAADEQSLRSYLKKVEVEGKTLTADNDKLKQDLSLTNAKLEEQGKVIVNLEAKVDDLENDKRHLGAEIDKLEAMIVTLGSTPSKQDRMINIAKETLNLKVAELETQHLVTDQLRLELEAAHQRIQSLEQELEAAREENKSLEQLRQENRPIMDELSRTMKTALKMVEDQAEDIEVREEALNRVLRQCDRGEAMLRDIAQRLTEINQTGTQMREEIMPGSRTSAASSSELESTGDDMSLPPSETRTEAVETSSPEEWLDENGSSADEEEESSDSDEEDKRSDIDRKSDNGSDSDDDNPGNGGSGSAAVAAPESTEFKHEPSVGQPDPTPSSEDDVPSHSSQQEGDPGTFVAEPVADLVVPPVDTQIIIQSSKSPTTDGSDGAAKSSGSNPDGGADAQGHDEQGPAESNSDQSPIPTSNASPNSATTSSTVSIKIRQVYPRGLFTDRQDYERFLEQVPEDWSARTRRFWPEDYVENHGMGFIDNDPKRPAKIGKISSDESGGYKFRHILGNPAGWKEFREEIVAKAKEQKNGPSRTANKGIPHQPETWWNSEEQPPDDLGHYINMSPTQRIVPASIGEHASETGTATSSHEARPEQTLAEEESLVKQVPNSSDDSFVTDAAPRSDVLDTPTPQTPPAQIDESAEPSVGDVASPWERAISASGEKAAKFVYTPTKVDASAQAHTSASPQEPAVDPKSSGQNTPSVALPITESKPAPDIEVSPPTNTDDSQAGPPGIGSPVNPPEITKPTNRANEVPRPMVAPVTAPRPRASTGLAASIWARSDAPDSRASTPTPTPSSRGSTPGPGSRGSRGGNGRRARRPRWRA